MIDVLCIVDVETSGVDPSKDVVLEAGAVLWSVAHRSVLGCWSSLVNHPEHPTNEAQAINQIPAAALPMGVTLSHATRVLCAMEDKADAIAAHNAAFDKSFLPGLSHPWIDTMDFDLPRSKPGDGLVKVALAHGVGVSSAHRAIGDCMLIASVLERVAELGVDLQELLQRGLRPRALFASLLPYEDGNPTNRAHGFKWDPELRAWTRRMALDDAKALPFPTRAVAA